MADLFNEDYLLHLCKKYNLQPSRQYGQNYLIVPEVIEAVLAAAELAPTDTVVEVGPGFGVLTTALAPQVKHVTSFEIEKKLEPYWAELSNKFSNIEIKWGNVLRQFQPPVVPYKVVANLPYQITSAAVRLFLEASPQPTAAIFMVQKEVAERICAKPGDMSLLAVATQYYAHPEYITTVPRNAFWPAPAVDSAIIRLKPYRATAPSDKQFFDLVRIGFAQRRKLLLKNLTPYVGKKNVGLLKEAFAEMQLLPTARAQELSLENWLQLFSVLPKI